MSLNRNVVFILIGILLLLIFLATNPFRQEGGSLRKVEGFDKVSIDTAGTVVLIQGDEEYVTIDAPKKILRRIATKVKNRTLHIGYRGLLRRPKADTVYTVAIKDIQGLFTSSSGTIEAEHILTDDLEIGLSSSGNIDIHTLEAKNMSVHVGASGDLCIQNGKIGSLRARLSSSGDFIMAGESDSLDINISSSGDFHGAALHTSSAKAIASSSGDAVLWVMDYLDAKLSSRGDISYYGKPELGSISESSSGRIRALGDK